NAKQQTGAGAKAQPGSVSRGTVYVRGEARLQELDGIRGAVVKVRCEDAAIAPRADRCGGKEQAPRKKPDELTEPVCEPRLLVVVVRVALAEKAQEMLVDEIKVEESVDVAGCGDVADGVAVVGIAQAAQDVPGRSDCKEEQDAGEEAHLAPAAPFSCNDEIGNDGGPEEDRRDESFRKQGNGQRRVGNI